MRILTRNSVASIIKVGVLTSLLASFMLLGVDLFKNLDSYLTYNVDGATVVKLTLLYFPEAFLFGMGPSFLFSVTYYLSMLHASNEIICVLNSGLSYRKFLIPCIITSVFVGLFYFGFNELVAIRTSNKKEAMFKVITFTENGSNDNFNVALSDIRQGCLVYADNYIDDIKTLHNLTYIEKSADGKLISRTDAYKAVWSEENRDWIFSDAYRYTPSEDGLSSEMIHIDEEEYAGFNIEPQLFRNLSAEVSKMSIPLARNYLGRMKELNPVQYASLGTEYYKRIFGFLTPLIMMIIACCLNYRFKRNVLFFSLICSICIAVIYYVIQMITLMLADQGIIKPQLGMIIPFISIIIITSIFSLILKD
ncbi:MAG: LptF/LptG family permease [Sphaerochaetaceae bacterium]|nr:LptF/LptG family permease [Sphaerochaetaceae bacterium]